MFHPPVHAYLAARFLHLQGLKKELLPKLGRVVLLHPVKGRTDNLFGSL